MFYEDLKEIRESKNITLEQIANKTKINIKMLKSFEEGNFTALTPMYVRLFLRAYTREIGEDSDEYLAKYEEYTTNGSNVTSKQNKKHIAAKNSQKIINTESMTDQQKIIWLSVSVVLIIFVVIILKQIFNDSDKPRTNSVPVSTQQFVDEETTSDTDISPDTSETNQSEMPDNQNLSDESNAVIEDENVIQEPLNLTLVMETNDSCWIKIIVDKADTSEGIFAPDRRQEWTGLESFDLRVGKPSAVSLFLNGNQLPYGTTDNASSRLLITKDGIINR